MSTFSLYSRNTSPVKSIRSFEVAIKVSMSTRADDGATLITPPCVTEKEVDCQINRLIESLNKLRRTAKAKLGSK
jgi:hypothetical protein